MEETDPPRRNLLSTKENEEQWRNLSQNLFLTLPKLTSWIGRPLYFFQGFWYPQASMKGLLYFQKYFKPHQTDIILASFPKSGTNWLKALIFTIVNRSRYSLKHTPMLTCNIHQLVPLFEVDLFQDDQFPDLDVFSEPRIIATHASYDSLPCSIKDSKNKIVYICRNPLDQFISFWNFLLKVRGRAMEIVPLDEAFESFCQGNHTYGPFWDHMLGYWRARKERSDKVLFLKYEEMKKNNPMYTKKLASFLGFPFSEDEEKQGLIQEISNFCSFDSMKNLEVHKRGNSPFGVPNNAFFRKGEVGDFNNYLSPDKIEKMEKLMQEKFGQIGLSFNIS